VVRREIAMEVVRIQVVKVEGDGDLRRVMAREVMAETR